MQKKASGGHFDVLVVGSGPAGHHAALKAAEFGKRVGIIERKPRIGGAGLQTGTIPSKSLREVAFLASRIGGRGMREALHRAPIPTHGLLSEVNRRKQHVITQRETVMLNALMQAGVDLISGEASFVDQHTLNIKTESAEYQITADVFILATGSRPRRPADVPFDKKIVLDSTSILKLKHLPSSLLVVGGGVIACEFATIFSAMGVEVSVVDSHPQILSYLSEDVVEVLMDSMRDFGVAFHLEQRVQQIVKHDNGSICTTMQSGLQLQSETLLYAQGREPNYQLLQPKNAGIDMDDYGWITVDHCYRTTIPHIYAVGDLIGRPALAATGMEQGRIAVQHALNGDIPDKNRLMPMAIYTIPELSWVGKTEKELKEEQADYVVGKAMFSDSARGQIIGDAGGFLKLNVERCSGKILGVHIIGESASELIHIGQLVMNLHGSVYDLLDNVFNYPTLAECYKIAARACLRGMNNKDKGTGI